ncbi:MAG: chemotaxis protein CheA [Bacteroidetes bacterium]|nr:chemotaxis protein CheA [Bacteroidota bacterium]
MSKEQEYREIFLAEAQESQEQLNLLFTDLEKDISNKKAIDAIFRITHTLKGNAMGMGFSEIAELSHVMEDVFNEVKNLKLTLDQNLFNSLYKANDILRELIDAVKEPKTVRYKGIKTKLEVILKNNRAASTDPVEDTINEPGQETLAPLNGPELQEEAHEQEEDESQVKITLSDTVQVPVRKLDALLNIVGELIIEKDSIMAKFTDRGNKASEFARLHRITSDLQFGVMDVRLVQVGFLFNKFHRILRDVAVIESKKVDLILEGTEIEIDRNIIRTMSDSLVHMIRNSVSHGIETPEKRKQAGKSETGKVYLRARNEKDTVFIEIEDDGAGIDYRVIKRKAMEKGIITKEYAEMMSKEEALMLIFQPGFSNAEKITEVSGRGVGMDVVKRATESIGGKIMIDTEVGRGSRFVLSLPSSMAVKGALLFELNKQEYALPLSYTEAVISLRKKDIHKVSNGLISTYLGNTISVIFLTDLYNRSGLNGLVAEGAYHRSFDRLDANQKLEVVIVTYEGKMVGFVVDKLLQQKEIVEKTLSNPVDKIELFSGATILGNGNICLVLDVASILSRMFKEKNNQAV